MSIPDKTGASSTGGGGAPSERSIVLRCPHCQAQGRIDWTALGRAIDCCHCSCRFIVQRDGQAVALSDLPQIAYTCPRCRSSGSVAAQIANRGARCIKCKLPLLLGPDQGLHSVDQAEHLRREYAKGRSDRVAAPSAAILFFQTSDRRWHMGRVAVAIIALLLLCMSAAIGLRSWLDTSPETLAARMLKCCLAGKATSAVAYLQDDDVQRVEFERWRLRHLSSLQDRYRPAGDRMRIEVTQLTLAGENATLLVLLKSPAVGQRELKLQWRLGDDGWKFDVVATLAEAGRRRATQQPPASRRLPGRPPVSRHLVPSGP